MTKDLIVITAKNAFGDSRTIDFVNPNCRDILKELDDSVKLLGYNDMQLYIALMEHAEEVAQRILKRK